MTGLIIGKPLIYQGSDFRDHYKQFMYAQVSGIFRLNPIHITIAEAHQHQFDVFKFSSLCTSTKSIEQTDRIGQAHSANNFVPALDALGGIFNRLKLLLYSSSNMDI